MSTGVFSMGSKKEHIRKFHVSDKLGDNPLVLNAKTETDAANFWAKRTGISAVEAVVTPIGTRGAPPSNKGGKADKKNPPGAGDKK